MNIGLFFGSYNPVHTGHLIIANFCVEMSQLNEVWFVVSPQNPFKTKESLLNEYDRLHLVELATEDNDHLRPSNIEFSLQKPSYTIDTLTYLKDKFPTHQFSLIMGSDNLATFHKWKNYERILQYYRIVVYQREGHPGGELANHQSVTMLNLPLINISASFIRNCIKKNVSVRYILPEKVYNYITEMNLYK